MRKGIVLILIASLIGLFSWTSFVQAGFGVTPPYINNSHLTPGSHYETTIYLVRGEPIEELTAEVSIDAPEIESWITIEKGLSFPLPKGIDQFPMKVTIDVPSDASLGDYQGYLRVRAVPSKNSGGQVSTVLGARIDIGINVTNEGFSSFEVEGITVPNFEKGSPLIVLVRLRNDGNVQARPSKVHLDIYDISHRKLLESRDITELGWIKPFETSQIQGSSPVELELGEYWADVSVYRDGESLGISEVHFKVVSELPKDGEETEDQSNENKWNFNSYIIVIGGFILLVILVAVSVFVKRRKTKYVYEEDIEEDIEEDSNNKKKKKKKISIEKK